MYYNKENVERLRQRYPEGARICLDQMNDDPFPVESGTFGKVNLRHVMNFGDGKFEIEILNTGEIVYDMEKFSEIAGKYV